MEDDLPRLIVCMSIEMLGFLSFFVFNKYDVIEMLIHPSFSILN